jgi:hypothetical protein
MCLNLLPQDKKYNKNRGVEWGVNNFKYFNLDDKLTYC